MHGLRRRVSRQAADLFLGNAGTAFRPLTAALALYGGHYRLSGVPRMHERPIGDLVDALRRARRRYPLPRQRRLPAARDPARRRLGDAARVSVRGDVSSQFLTALLMALPLPGRTTVRRGRRRADLQAVYRDHARPDGAFRRRRSSATAGQRSRSRRPGAIAARATVHVEGDASSASYFLAAGAIGGGPVRVEGVGRDSIQGDVRFAEAAGADGRAGSGRRQLDRGARARERQAAGVRSRPEPHSRRRHDAGGGRAVRRRPVPAAQYRQLAGQGNRPHCGDGHRAAQSRRAQWRRARTTWSSRRRRGSV